MGMSSGVSTTVSQKGGTPQHGGLQAEASTASVSMPAAAQQPSTPGLHPSHQHAPQSGQGFSAWYQQTDGTQQAAHGASEQAHAKLSVRSWADASGSEQAGSPAANNRMDSAGGVDTPKTLQLKALAAQAERLKQVGLLVTSLH